MSRRKAEAILKRGTPVYIADVQIIGRNFPSGYEWLERFDYEEQIEFYWEVLGAITQAKENGRWERVSEVIEAWWETGMERTEVDLQKKLQEARREFASGKGHPWEEVRKELDM